ncbi:formin-like protein 3, partial [Pyrgilauda ruficollis]|uniref:formin-like protein 3 n=1 Tax=Pyrgilauda ruficollis TaxID=221976 RepID=UPI001B87B946
MGNVESADGEALPRGPGTPAAPGGAGLFAPGKMPMPEPCELEERFALVLSSMNLPPDKARLLRQYDNEKKWDLICDQERFQVKSPPHAYIQKLRSFLEPGVTRKKFRRRVQESTKVLRELEISLRTNHIGWVREFLNDENKGLDVLVNYLSFAQCAVMLDFEGLEGGEDGALEKLRSWSRSIEDLQHPSALPAPFTSSLARSARQTALRYGTLPSRRALKNSRLVSQKDDVHLCIMCLRAIMNYQYGFNLVMSHPHAVNEIALSLNNKNPRMKALVLELLAAVCLVRGGHEIILAAFDNFKEVQGEWEQGSSLVLGCSRGWVVSRIGVSPPSDGSTGKCPPAPPLPGASPSIALTVGLSAIRIKKPIKTKFRLPVFNWTALKPSQISGTVFSELDDERVLEDLDLERFEELFKTKAQGPALDLVCAKSKAAQKVATKVTLLEANRAKNLAITLRKAGRSADEICRAIHTYGLSRGGQKWGTEGQEWGARGL